MIFDYDEYKSDTFWDFDWKNDKWTIIGTIAVVIFCAGVITWG